MEAFSTIQTSLDILLGTQNAKICIGGSLFLKKIKRKKKTTVIFGMLDNCRERYLISVT